MLSHLKIEENKLIAPYTWFQAGGNAKYFCRPKNIDQLKEVLEIHAGEELLVLGAGSNILVRDGGFDGLVIKLSKLNNYQIEDSEVIVEAGALNRTLVYNLAEEGFSNLEFMIGIPGTIGGAVAMNAGCYGFEVKDFLQWVDVLLSSGEVVRLDLNNINMTYRYSDLPKGAIVMKACFTLKKGSPKSIVAKCEDYLRKREETQPVRGRTGGSTFKNPEGQSAWKLLDEAGCRGLSVRDAVMSEKHCNFLINKGSATSADIEELILICQEKVFQKTGIHLEAEIKLVGCK